MTHCMLPALSARRGVEWSDGARGWGGWEVSLPRLQWRHAGYTLVFVDGLTILEIPVSLNEDSMMAGTAEPLYYGACAVAQTSDGRLLVHVFDNGRDRLCPFYWFYNISPFFLKIGWCLFFEHATRATECRGSFSWTSSIAFIKNKPVYGFGR